MYISKILNPQFNKSVQNYYDNIIKAITKSLQMIQNENKEEKPHKILSERTIQLMKRRKELQMTKNKSRAMKNEISALYKLISKYIKRDYTNHRNNTIEKHINQTGGTKKAYKELRTNKTWIDGLKQGEKTLNNRNEIIDVATHFYKNLYNARETISTESRDKLSNNSNLPVPQIEVSEVTSAIKALKKEKSPGSDGITNEILKTGSTTLTAHLTELFNLIIETGETPAQWSESDIILIYKKGDPNDIGNYRPISLLPTIYKLFSSIINKRINLTLQTRQPIEQAGFRKGYSTIDHIHTMELLIEKYREKNRPLYIAYIDYQKAFDCVYTQKHLGNPNYTRGRKRIH